ncbi:MAG: P-loop NTPase [Chloroflexi bacterium]|nr:P-loop NTPase [Chloroflexota bacterium]
MSRRKKGRSSNAPETPSRRPGGNRPVPLRLAAGLGDPERERSLLSALTDGGEVVLAERCLSADQLLSCVHRGQVDAILAAADLHRLSEGRLHELVRTGVPLVVLAPDAGDSRWQSLPGAILPLDADPEAVRRSLRATVRGERPRPASHTDEPVESTVPSEDPTEKSPADLSVLAVTSGPGSPGRTTVALNLAVALGAVAPTILVDADLSGPSVAAYLDLDPTRNLAMLAHAEPETSREWDRAIAQEVQPLGPGSRHGVALCGVPKPEMRGGITAPFFERLLAELRGRYRYLILDVGWDLLGPGAEIHRLALASAQRVLLVASADLVGLWRARMALGLLHAHHAIDPERVALVVNRHDRRHGHGRREIEWALHHPVAALVPFDHAGLQRALDTQRPLVLDNRSRAGRALLDLAERIHGGSIELPPEPSGPDRRARLGRMPWVPWRRASVAKTPEGA